MATDVPNRLTKGSELRRTLRRDIESATTHSFVILVATALGAILDEFDHSGLRTMLSLCASGPIPIGSLIHLQLQLLPAMMATMGICFVVTAIWRVGVAAAHLGCIAAMLASSAVCATFANRTSSVLAGSLLMFGTDAVIALCVAVLIAVILRITLAPAANVPSDADCCAPNRALESES